MRLVFGYDKRTHAALVADDDEARAAFGDPLDLARLPISDAARTALRALPELYENSCEECFPAEGAWGDLLRAKFDDAARAARELIVTELGPAVVVVNAQGPLR